MADISVTSVIATCTSVLSFLTFLVWQIYSKASATRASDMKTLNDQIDSEAKSLSEKIDTNTGHCVNKQLNLEMQIGQVRSMVIDHKLEAITRQDAHSLFEEKIKPIKESLDDLKSNQKEVAKENNLKFDTVLKALSRIEGIMSTSTRRRDDE